MFFSREVGLFRKLFPVSTMLSGLVLLGLFFQGCDSAPSPASAQPAAATQPADQIQSVDRQIRILLLDGIQTAAISVRDHFNVVDAESGEILLLDQPPADLTVVFMQQGIEIPELEVQVDSVVEIVPTGEEPTQVKLTEEWRDFSGSLRFMRRNGGGALINLIDMEDYLAAVVSAELPASFHRETFRAQAIAARTYAWYARQTTGLRRDWDVWATERSQVYGSLERQRQVPQAAKAVRDTRGIVCTWSAPAGEKIFCTYYGSRCGGFTAPAPNPAGGPEVLPLAGGVPCPYCLQPDAYRWPEEPKLKRWQIKERLMSRYSRFEELGIIERVEVVEATQDGRALRVAVVDTEQRSIELDAENFRLAVDPTGRLLQSTCFTMVSEPDGVIFADGKGMGHGMGLCQYGANHLARQGWNAPTILKHYYPGSRLTRAY